jgi:hypothetical protein
LEKSRKLSLNSVVAIAGSLALSSFRAISRDVRSDPMKKTTKTTAPKPATKATAKVATTKSAKSMFSGKKLFPSRSAKQTNPRRPESYGFRSLEVIRANPGITYEDFLRAGGRRVDLAWDLRHGNAEARG